MKQLVCCIIAAFLITLTGLADTTGGTWAPDQPWSAGTWAPTTSAAAPTPTPTPEPSCADCWDWQQPTAVTDKISYSAVDGTDYVDFTKDGCSSSGQEALVRFYHRNGAGAGTGPRLLASPDGTDWYTVASSGHFNTDNYRTLPVDGQSVVPLDGTGGAYFKYAFDDGGFNVQTWQLLACRDTQVWTWINGGEQAWTDVPTPSASNSSTDFKKDDDATAAECASGDEALTYLELRDNNNGYLSTGPTSGTTKWLLYQWQQSGSNSDNGVAVGFQEVIQLNGSGVAYFSATASGATYVDTFFRLQACRAQSWAWTIESGNLTDLVPDTAVGSGSKQDVDLKKNDGPSNVCDGGLEGLIAVRMRHGTSPSQWARQLQSNADTADTTNSYSMTLFMPATNVGWYEDEVPRATRFRVQLDGDGNFDGWFTASQNLQNNEQRLLACRSAN